MVGIDTNILVRYFAQDDAGQAKRATAFIDSLSKANPGFISFSVLAELIWVMRSQYKTSKDEVVDILGMLLRIEHFSVADHEIVKKALLRYAQTSAQFSDCLIECSARAAGCSHTVTFDQQAAKSAGMRIVP